jgi:hypothetical protein
MSNPSSIYNLIFRASDYGQPNAKKPQVYYTNMYGVDDDEVEQSHPGIRSSDFSTLVVSDVEISCFFPKDHALPEAIWVCLLADGGIP